MIFLFNNYELIFLTVCCLIGLLILLISIYYLIVGFQSYNWPFTIGQVINSDVNKREDSDSTTGTQYKPEIIYSYKVQNQKFISSKISFVSDFYLNSSIRAFRLVDKYPKDSNVQVYYDPEDPSDSVLEVGINYKIILLLAVGITLFSISLILANNKGLFDFLK